MAITLDNIIDDGTIDVIIRSDSALDVTSDEYDEYAKTLDEGHLKFKDGDSPTRWVLRKKLKYKDKMRVDNSKVRIESGEMQLQIGFMTEEIKAALVDIKNPEHVPPEKRLVLKKNGDGTVSEEFMAMLGDIPQELYGVRNAYLNAKKTGVADLKKS